MPPTPAPRHHPTAHQEQAPAHHPHRPPTQRHATTPRRPTDRPAGCSTAPPAEDATPTAPPPTRPTARPSTTGPGTLSPEPASATNRSTASDTPPPPPGSGQDTASCSSPANSASDRSPPPKRASTELDRSSTTVELERGILSQLLCGRIRGQVTLLRASAIHCDHPSGRVSLLAARGKQSSPRCWCFSFLRPAVGAHGSRRSPRNSCARTPYPGRAKGRRGRTNAPRTGGEQFTGRETGPADHRAPCGLERRSRRPDSDGGPFITRDVTVMRMGARSRRRGGTLRTRPDCSGTVRSTRMSPEGPQRTRAVDVI